MTTKDYTHITVKDGIGRPKCPYHPETLNYDKAVAQFNSNHASTEYHCFTHDGKPLADGVYGVEEFGDAVEEFLLDGNWHKFNKNTEDWFRASGNETRLVLYLKAPAISDKLIDAMQFSKIPIVNDYFKATKSMYHDYSYQEAIEKFANHLIQQGYKSPQEVEELVTKWKNVEIPCEIGKIYLVETGFFRKKVPFSSDESLENKEWCTEVFTAYCDENGDCIVYPTDDSYGWEWYDCVLRYCELPEPPKNLNTF